MVRANGRDPRFDRGRFKSWAGSDMLTALPARRGVPLTVGDYAYRARSVYGDRIAVVDEPRQLGSLGTLTYEELFARADGLARKLDQLGLGPGERIAIVSPNCAKFLIALFAVAGTGRILVPINFRLGADEIRHILSDAEPGLVFFDPEIDERLAGASFHTRKIVLDGEDDGEFFLPADLPGESSPISEDDPATLNYTSGTTAAPKGVVLSHRSHWLNAAALGWELGVAQSDRYLHTLPLFHVNGWGLPLANAAFGVPNIVQRNVEGAEVLSRVDEHGVTLLCGAAPVLAAIARAAERLKALGEPVPGAGVVRMVSGGAATPAALIDQFEAATGWEMIHAYGLTEAAPVLTVNRLTALQREASPGERANLLTAAGVPLLGVRIALADDDEILVRAAKAFSGYWRDGNSADSRSWLETGDLGVVDRGVLRVRDRKKDIIVSGGENISPAEVEACIDLHPSVSESAVVGVPDDRWGEVPRAFVVPRAGAGVSESEIVQFCRDRLAHFKCPSSVTFVSEIPRTATGKIQRFVLADAVHALSETDTESGNAEFGDAPLQGS